MTTLKSVSVTNHVHAIPDMERGTGMIVMRRTCCQLTLQRSLMTLLQACRENHVSIVELLLDYGASVNATFPNSRYVLVWLWSWLLSVILVQRKDCTQAVILVLGQNSIWLYFSVI